MKENVREKEAMKEESDSLLIRKVTYQIEWVVVEDRTCIDIVASLVVVVFVDFVDVVGLLP